MSFLNCSCGLPVKFLGCFSSCDDQTLPIYAPINGDYIIQYWKQGTLIQKTITIEAAPERIVTTHVFPENSVTEFRIIDPNGYTLKYNLLRDALGVKDIPNPPDSPCCEVCQTRFTIELYYSFALPDDEAVLVDPCP